MKGTEDLEGIRLSQGDSIFTMKQLQILHDELHLDHPPRTELEVEPRAPLDAFLLHPVAHGIDPLAKIGRHRLLEDERLYETEESLFEPLISGHYSGLDVGLSLPALGQPFEMVPECCDRLRERSFTPSGAEAGVHPVR